MIASLSLTALAELFPVFEALEEGRSVALRSSAECTAMTDPPGADAPHLGVSSSGSTGQPKLVWRPWAKLKSAASVRPEVASWTWAAPYQPCSFAGVQVAVQAWLTSKRVISLATASDAAWRQLLQACPEALSATPTFVDLLLQNEPPEGQTWAPRQITLGGEPLRPALGARLKHRFPSVHFTVIYAAAELGVLARTSRLDGWYELLSLRRHAADWRLVDGLLEIQTASGWQRTGDLVEVEGDCFRVRGRGDRVANVAGTKVDLIRVAELAEQVPGVLRAVAMAEPSPIAGQVVCLRFALERHVDADQVEAELQARLRAQLRKEAWPRRWVRDDVAPVNNAKRAV